MRPGQIPIGAQLIVHNAEAAYGFRAYPSAQRGGPWHVLGSGYTLFAVPCSATEPPSGRHSDCPLHVPGFTEKLVRSFTWQRNIPVRAQAMALTENALLLAGSPDIVRPDADPYAAVEGKLRGRLLERYGKTPSWTIIEDDATCITFNRQTNGLAFSCSQ